MKICTKNREMTDGAAEGPGVGSRAQSLPPLPQPPGLPATLAWMLVIAVAITVSQIPVMLIIDAMVENRLEPMLTVGRTMSIIAITCVPAAWLLCTGIFRIYGYRPGREALNLAPPPGRTTLRWMGMLVILMVVTDLATWLKNGTVVHSFTMEIYETCPSFLLFFVGVAVAAPLYEELIFRGFLFKCLENSRVRGLGAVIITALLWAVIHIQYEWFSIFTVFCFGLLLGAARLKTGSTSLAILLHFVLNATAIAELLIALRLTP